MLHGVVLYDIVRLYVIVYRGQIIYGMLMARTRLALGLAKLPKRL